MNWHRFLLAIAIVLAGCTQVSRPNLFERETTQRFANRFDQRQGIADRIESARDPWASPCDDFYRYACGRWLDDTDVDGRLLTGFGLYSLEERNRIWLWQVVEGTSAADSGTRAQLAAFFRGCLDDASATQVGLEPLRPLFDRIDGVGSVDDLMPALVTLHRAGVGVLFRVGVVAHPLVPEAHVVLFHAPTLGLPRDTYLKRDMKSRDAIEAYTSHITRMFELAGGGGAAEPLAGAVVELERSLAEAVPSTTIFPTRGEVPSYVSMDELTRMAAPLPMTTYLHAAGFGPQSEAAVTTPEYFAHLAQVVSAADPVVLRAYLRWSVLHALATGVPPFRDQYYDFFARAILPQSKPVEPWRRCAMLTETMFGDLVADAYLEDARAAEAAQQANSLIAAVRASAVPRLRANAWMAPATRQLAIDKLEAADVFLGHPNRDAARETLALSPQRHLDNMLVGYHRAFDRLVRADGAEAAAATWQVAPFTPTAYYRPQFNDVLLPIGIVQAPVFDPRFDAALNYGALGSIVGHELFHAFDANGRRFDAHGRPREWWDSQTSLAFGERMQCLSDHLGHYEALPATPASAAVAVDSKRVADETIADIAGVTIAFDAYRAHVAANDEPPTLIEGLTGDQLFFIAYAQVWCAELNPAYALFLAGAAPHAPPHVRVNAVLSQVPEFAEAFKCDRHTPMRPANPCGLWSAMPPAAPPRGRQ